MKQKNMVLMAVAVCCGLVAAFLTTRLTGSQAPQVDMAEVLVAKKDLPVGTVLAEKEFNELLTKQQMPKASLPPDTITDAELLKGKRLSRTIRQGNYFAPGDVGGNAGIEIPKGMQMYSMKMDAVHAVTGFIFPGDKVDVLALLKSRKETNKRISRRILIDMLVLAVDVHDRRPEGGGASIPTIQAVSLAVKPEQAQLLHTAEADGGDLRLIRRPEGFQADDPSKDKPDDLYENDAPIAAAPVAAVSTVDVAIIKKEVPLNTRITDANLAEYFELKPVLAPAPEKAIRDLAELKNKFVIVGKLPEELPILSSALSDKELVLDPKVEEPKHEDPIVAEKPKPVEPRESHTLTIQGPQGGVQRFRFEGKSRQSLRLTDKAADEKETIESEKAPAESDKKDAATEEADTPKKPEEKPAKNPKERVT